MREGIAKTYGKKALTIVTDEKEQFYAPFENVEKLIMPFLKVPYTPIHVSFEVDYNNWSGHANGKKRYFAYNVKISDEIII